MKRTFALFFALCIGIMALSSCSGGLTESSEPESNIAQEAAPTPEPTATPEPTPSPTPEPVKWVEVSYKGLTLSVPEYWEREEGNDYLGYNYVYDDEDLYRFEDDTITWVGIDVKNIDYKLDAADFDQGLTWNKETMSALRKADIKETDRSLGIFKPDPEGRTIDEMLIDGQPATVYGKKTEDGNYWDDAEYLTGIGGKYVSISVWADREASPGTRKAFDADVTTMLESIQLSGIPAVAQREAALGEPLTLIKTESTEKGTEYWAVVPRNFTEYVNEKISTGTMIWDFLDEYPISGVGEDENALTIIFINVGLEKQYSFSFEYGVLKSKAEVDMTVEEIEALIPSEPD